MRLPSVLMTAGLALWFTSCGGPSWQTYYLEDSTFSVAFPRKPELTQEAMDLPVGHAIFRTYMVEDPSTAYGVALTDYPGEYLSESSTEDAMDGAQSSAMANINGRVLSSTDTMRYGLPLRSVKFDAPDVEAQGCLDLYLDGNRSYALLAIEAAPAGMVYLPSPEASAFLRSFKVLRRAGGGARRSPPIKWTEFTSRDGAFRVLMPHKPLSETLVLPHPEAGDIVQYSFHTAHSGLTFAVAYSVFAATADDERAVVKVAADCYALGTGGTSLWSHDTTVQGHAAHMMRIKSEESGDHELLVIQAGARQYIAVVWGQIPEIDGPETRHFLSSFRLLQ